MKVRDFGWHPWTTEYKLTKLIDCFWIFQISHCSNIAGIHLVSAAVNDPSTALNLLFEEGALFGTELNIIFLPYFEEYYQILDQPAFSSRMHDDIIYAGLKAMLHAIKQRRYCWL